MLNVEIISPAGIIFQGSCHLVTVPSVAGEIGVMQNHEAFVAQLQAGKVIIYNERQEVVKEVEVVGGFAQIDKGEKLVVLLDS